MNSATATTSNASAALSKKTHSLFWKEWRARGWWPGVVAAAWLGALLLIVTGPGEHQPAAIGKHINPFVWMAWSLAAILLGSISFPRIESQAALCWMYGLPVSRAAVVRWKLVCLGAQWALLALWGMASGWAVYRLIDPELMVSWRFGAEQIAVQLILAVMIGLFLSQLATVVAFYIPRPLIVVMLTALLGLPIALLSWGAILGKFVPIDAGYWFPLFQLDGVEEMSGASLRLGLLCVSLTAWLSFATSNTRVQEASPAARAGLLLVFAAALGEAAYTLLRAGVFDLMFLVLGG